MNHIESSYRSNQNQNTISSPFVKQNQDVIFYLFFLLIVTIPLQLLAQKKKTIPLQLLELVLGN